MIHEWHSGNTVPVMHTFQNIPIMDDYANQLKKEGYIKKKENELALLENHTKFIKEADNLQSLPDIANLNDSDKGLRWAAFLLFTSPLFGYLISPEIGQRITKAWAELPEWQAQMLNVMCIAVFGLKQIPNMLGNVIGTIFRVVKK